MAAIQAFVSEQPGIGVLDDTVDLAEARAVRLAGLADDEQVGEEPGIVNVGRGGQRRQRKPIRRNDHVVLGSRLAAVGGVRAGQRPTALGTHGTAIHNDVPCLGGGFRAGAHHADQYGVDAAQEGVVLHSISRRRNVDPEARSGNARSSRHCTPSSRKKRSVSRTVLVGTGGRPVPMTVHSIWSMTPATNSTAVGPLPASP